MNTSLFALMIAALILSIIPPVPVQAQAGTAMDLVQAVNSYRAAQGLEPYGVDGGLMSLAQSHSEYQASIEDCTHTRADGTGPEAHGIAAENIACGNDLSVNTAIYSQWADQLHTATMLGPTTGLVGAGVASAGSKVYYTLTVKRLTGDFNYTPPQTSGAAESPPDQPDQPPAQAPGDGGVPTSTPNPDGSIAHIIKYGETLVDIAERYGISLADLISMNQIDPQNPVYYEKQVLIIRLAFTETPFITSTYTPRAATRTPMPSRTPRPTRTATAFRSPVPTRTATAEPLVQVPTLEDLGPARPILAYSFIAISGLGLLVLIFTSFWPEKKG